MKKEKLGELIIESEDSLYRVARSLLNNDTDCADAISETIVVAFEKLHTLQNEKFAKTWLTRILINECYKIMRDEKRITFIDVSDENSTGSDDNRYSDLYEAIGCLPRERRTTILLYYIEGYSVKETADILQTTESAVKNRLLKARSELKEFLMGEEKAL